MDPVSPGGSGGEGLLGLRGSSNSLFWLWTTLSRKFTLANITIFYVHQDVEQLGGAKENKINDAKSWSHFLKNM